MSASDTAVAPKSWTIGSLVKWAVDDFRARGIDNPRLDAELLVAHALKIDRMRVILDGERQLDDVELAALRALIKRRRAFEPIAYLRGERMRSRPSLLAAHSPEKSRWSSTAPFW